MDRIEKFAHILVDYSANIQPGDRVAIEATTAAEPLVRALYKRILERGGHPYLLLDLIDQNELFYAYGGEDQFSFTPPLRKLAYDEFESRIFVRSEVNTRALSMVKPAHQAMRQRAEAPILEAQMQRGAAKEFKWVTTQYPTSGYAEEAGMKLDKYEDFLFRACHADQDDPVAYWKSVEEKQRKIIKAIEGGEKVALRGPNVDLTLSIKGRKFNNACGQHNMPDGEIYTGPVEESVNGWVKFTYPAVYQGRAVEGVELTFVEGRVFKASAQENQDFLLKMLETDEGSRYLGEFAIGTNFDIDQFTNNILFDEKIGGSFHMALGAGYPETGSKNKSSIHWDLICDMRKDAEILVDGEVIYRNGDFVI